MKMDIKQRLREAANVIQAGSYGRYGELCHDALAEIERLERFQPIPITQDEMRAVIREELYRLVGALTEAIRIRTKS